MDRSKFPSTIVVTGASGFLGQSLLKSVAVAAPDAAILPVASPRSGGVDLSRADAPQVLSAALRIAHPEDAILIHAAAKVAWDTPDALLTNAAMALNTATWARSTGIGFSVLVSSVSVYPVVAHADVNTPCDPQTLYGIGKLTAEHVWRQILSAERSCVVRLAGVWGWQQAPTLFWNRLLLAAVRGSPPERTLVVRRARSVRNYIPAAVASECILRVGTARTPGLFLAAGPDTLDNQKYIALLQNMPGSRLSVDWQDDGQTDQQVYAPSPEFASSLRSISELLPAIWATKPEWLSESNPR